MTSSHSPSPAPSTSSLSSAPPDDVEGKASAPVIRQLIAVAAFANMLVATYLHLWKLGYMGTLSCGAERGCEVVQLSSWGWFLGIDVALIGAIGYAIIFTVAVVGTRERHQDAR